MWDHLSIRIEGKNNSDEWFFLSKLTLNHPQEEKEEERGDG